MGEHLPILQVILPLIAAPVCLLIRHGAVCWLIATLVSWACLAIAVLLLLQALDGGAIRYQLGDWVAPWGIEYVVDRLNGFILVIVAAIGAVVAPYALRSVADELPQRQNRPVLCDVPAVPGRPARHHDHRRRLQRLRVPRNFLAVVLCTDQPGPAPQGAARRLPVSGHGNDRGDLLLDRRRLALPDDRDPQHGRSRGPAETARRLAHRAGGLRLHRRRHGAEAGRLPTASVAAERLRPRALGGQRLPRRNGDQGVALCRAALHFHRLRFRIQLRRPAVRPRPAGSRHRRHRRLLAGGDLPGRCQAPARLVVGGADRLHAARPVLCHGARACRPACCTYSITPS